MPELQAKAAVITGGTKGIGRAIAEALAGEGVAVAVTARSASDVDRVAAALVDRGARAIGIAADVRRAEDCQRLVDETVEAFGRLDILVNNAGVGLFAPAGELAIEDWQRVIETNLNGPFYCSRAAIPHLRSAGDSWIINIGSLAGKHAFPGGAAYNASKFGLIGFSEALMQDVRHDGIRVSCIMPGSVATEFRGEERGEDAWKVQPEDLAGIVLDLLRTPARTLPSRIEVRPSRPPKR